LAKKQDDINEEQARNRQNIATENAGNPPTLAVGSTSKRVHKAQRKEKRRRNTETKRRG
jgi:hypothetical protein